jgi:serine/threonine protein kinase/WD40 repeat protein
MDADRQAAAATPPGADDAEAVQRAVEQFIERHASGEQPDLGAFVAGLPEPLRPRVLAQCREYLAFDGLLGHQPWQPTPSAAPGGGRTFGEFTILEELGRGGMGVVYLAQQPSLHRRVALKVMASGLTLSKRHVERFRREAAAAAAVRHPAIVPVHTLIEVDGTFAMAMDFVAGRNLGDLLDDLRLRAGPDGAPANEPLGLAPEKGYVAECAMFAAQLASGLAAAHQAGVVHRDLKPRNLMLDDRRQVRLLDFGLAKSLDDGSISISGEIAGTPHYMSPEQTLAKRVEVDHRADVWALGVILYELLTLKRPFDGRSLQQIVYEICFVEPTPIHKRNPRVPRDLATVCMKALEKDPNRRYASAAEFEADLLRFLRWEPVHARPASTWTRASKWMRRHRTETAVAAIAAFAGLAAVGFDVVRGRQADGILARAADAAQQGKLGDAYQLAAQALALRPDDATRARMERYAEADKRIDAESAALAMRSANLIGRDRERALQLALQADDLRSSASTRTALLEALGSGSLARTLRLPDGASPRFVGARLSPDGRLAATIGYAGHAQLWDVADGAPRAALRGHGAEGTVVGVAFCGDGAVATAGTDRTLRWWRASDGAPLRAVELPGVAAALQASADGRRLLVLCYSGAEGPFHAQAYDAASGAPLGPQRTFPQLVLTAAFAPDGRHAAASSGQDVQLWRVDDGADVGATAKAGGRVRAFAFTRDGQRLAVAGGRAITVLATSDGRTLAAGAHSQDVTALAFDGGGERLLSGARDRTARVWQLPPTTPGGAGELREIATLTGHQGGVDHVAFDAADQFALTATGDGAGELRVFDVGSGRPILGTALHRYEAGPSIEAADFAADGRSALALAGQGRALVWDFGRARGVATLRQAAGAAAVAAAGSDHVVTVGSDGRARLWRTDDGALGWATPPLGDPLTCVDVDRTTQRFAAASRQSGTVRLRDLMDGAGPQEFAAHGEAVTALRFVADGRLFTAGVTNRIGEFALWNARTGERLASGSRPRAIGAADVTADGALCAVAEVDDTTVRLLSLPDGAVRAEMPTAKSRVVAVQFTKAGDALLVAERDGLVHVHGIDGTLRTTIRTDQTLRRAVWSPDSASILTGGDGSVAEAVLWHVADGSERLRFRGHRGPIEWATFLGDGSACATAARDGTVCLWPTDPAAFARRLIPPPPADGK